MSVQDSPAVQPCQPTLPDAAGHGMAWMAAPPLRLARGSNASLDQGGMFPTRSMTMFRG